MEVVTKLSKFGVGSKKVVFFIKPNFNEMSREELKAYVLSHRDDDEALRALCNRPSSNTEKIVFSPPKTPQ